MKWTEEGGKNLPRQAWRLLRIGEWWDKFLHLSGAAFLLWRASTSGKVSNGAFLLYVAAVSSLLTVGYTVNSAADFHQDTISGQRAKRSSHSRKLSIVSALAAMAMAAFFILAATEKTLPRLIALATLVVGCGYSLPPWRFKERGIWGVLVGALTQKPALFLIIAAMLDAWNSLCVLLMFWLFCGGMLGMLGHQILDRAADEGSGVRTFVTVHGTRQAARLCLIFAAAVAFACVAPLALFPIGNAAPITALLSALSAVFPIKGWRAKRQLLSAATG